MSETDASVYKIILEETKLKIQPSHIIASKMAIHKSPDSENFVVVRQLQTENITLDKVLSIERISLDQ